MTEELDEKQEQHPGAPPRDLTQIIRVGMGVAAVLFAVLAGLLTFRFLLAPLLAEPQTAELDEGLQPIPMNPVSVDFPMSFVNVIREDDFPASTLLFGVTLECGNQLTADLIEMHRPRFTDMLIKLHDSRTRTELDDTLALKMSIQRQALQKCNDLLRRTQVAPDPQIRVTAVFHHAFTVQDQL